MSSSKPLRSLALVLVVVAGIAWVARARSGLRHAYEPGASEGWFSIDPDGLYHTRRVERVFREGLPVAGTDPYLNSPDGARIPWPPYYDLAVWAALAPFAPAEPEARHTFLEHAVASLPMLFGIAAALVAALAVWWLASPDGSPTAALAGALVAGAYAALSRGSINYSSIGTGDHHAWVALLFALIVLGLSRAFDGRALRSRARGALAGALLGVFAGLALGSWVASLLFVVYVDLALGWMLLRRAREELPGLAALGLAFHLVTALVLFPAVLSSPWRAEFPWMVVNLSWFHPSFLVVAALVFVPPLALEGSTLASRTRAAKLYPLVVALALGVLALGLAKSNAGPARGIAEGFEWVSRADQFMDTVLESFPLVGPRSGGTSELFGALGYGLIALPFAWAALAWRGFARRADALVPWAIVVPPLLVQALGQRRFSCELAVPFAVVLGWGAMQLARRWNARIVLACALPIVLAAQIPSLRRTLAAYDFHPDRREDAGRADYVLGERRAIDWIRTHAHAPASEAVLSHWDRGHLIEWAADRPSVATNFGSYVGIESYRDPSRFFLSEDPREADAILGRRRARYVLVPASLPHLLESMTRVVNPALRDLYMKIDPVRGAMTNERWNRTLGARLISDGLWLGAPEGEKSPLGSLRLVHVSAFVNPGYVDPRRRTPRPASYVWERVQGALLEAHGTPGDELRVSFQVEFPSANYALRFEASARCDVHGIARVRVPYASDAPNGDGLVREPRWSLSGRGGALAIPEQAVTSGATIAIE